MEVAEAGLVPELLVAVTVHAYVAPTVSAPITIGLAVPEADLVTPPVLLTQLTRKLPMAAPPSPLETNATLAWRKEGARPVIVGEAGTAGTTMAGEGADTVPNPWVLRAVTLHV